MIPRALIKSDKSILEELDGRTITLNFTWATNHPGDEFQQEIIKYIQKHGSKNFSHFLFYRGHVIFIKWLAQKQFGISAMLASKSRNIFKIGIDSYHWINYVKTYTDEDIGSFQEAQQLFQKEITGEEISQIPRQIKRPWFDISMEGGKIIIQREEEDFNYAVANLFGYFPWIIFFGSGGEISDKLFSIDIDCLVSSDREFSINYSEIYGHIDAELDGSFWKLIYQFIDKMEEIPNSRRMAIWHEFLDVAHQLTIDQDVNQIIKVLENNKNVLHHVEIEFLKQLTLKIIDKIANEEQKVENCRKLLNLAKILVDIEYTDLSKLAEGTALELSLKLPATEKMEIISELTKRSSTWGEKHLISFVESITDLLSGNLENKEILSEVINMVQEDLRRSWEGMLCLVDGKLIADRIEDAIILRFEATNLIADKFTKAEDIFTSIIWSLEFKTDKTEIVKISTPYLDYAFDTLSPLSLIEQSDILVQKSLLTEKYDFLRNYLQYLRKHLRFLENKENMANLVIVLDHLLTSKRDYPLVYIEFFLIKLYIQQFHESINLDKMFQLVGQIFNSINPSNTDSEETLQYISTNIIEVATLVGEWSIVDETQRRYLLLTKDPSRTNKHLKNIFFSNAILRSKMATTKTNGNEIAIQLFQEGMTLAEIDEDYDLITKILPHIKKLALKSQSYNKFTELMLLDVRLRKTTGKDWETEFYKDIDKLVGRDEIRKIQQVFQDILEQFDLTQAEKTEIMRYELKLVETEPDLLTADEIYNKRLQLVNSGGLDEEEHHKFMIENFQQGISELIAKGDSSNLTNILLEALNYAIPNNAPEAVEFKDILLDNIENIIEDFKAQHDTDIYLYLLSVWRKMIEEFKNTDLRIILVIALKLFELNFEIYEESLNRQYLRRSQLVINELGYIIADSQIKLTDEEISELFDTIEVMYKAIQDTRSDYGIFMALNQMSLFYKNIGFTPKFFEYLDEGIGNIKKQIIRDEMARSAIVFLLFIICELSNQLEVEHEEIARQELFARLDGIINFALSLDLPKSVKQEIRKLRNNESKDLSRIIREIPEEIEKFLDFSM